MREESKKKVLASSSGAEDAVTLTPEQLTAELDLQMKLSWACIISAILGCGFFYCVCCSCSSLKAAIDVIDASSDFIA